MPSASPNSHANRWAIAVAGVIIQIALGAVYAWSVFRIPLTRAYGWSISQVTFAFTPAAIMSRLSCTAGIRDNDGFDPTTDDDIEPANL